MHELSPDEALRLVLAVVADRHKNRDDVVLAYRLCLHDALEQLDWPKVNRAIVDRWSINGLDYIKRHAWRDMPHRCAWCGDPVMGDARTRRFHDECFDALQNLAVSA